MSDRRHPEPLLWVPFNNVGMTSHCLSVIHSSTDLVFMLAELFMYQLLLILELDLPQHWQPMSYQCHMNNVMKYRMLSSNSLV